MPDFILYAYIAGFLVAFMAGPLGALIAWQRISFLGHTLAHSALIGVTLAIVLDIEVLYGVIVISVLISLIFSFLFNRKLTSPDTSMGIIANGSLALSLVFIALLPEAQRYIYTYLFGDILALSMNDLIFLGFTVVISFSSLFFLWKPLLRLTIHEGIAKVEGPSVLMIRSMFMVLVALVVSVSLKVLGGLLMTAMLILPAASARPLVHSPEQMAVMSTIMGVLSIIIGIEGAGYFDVPPAAFIIVANLIILLITHLFKWSRNTY